MPEIACTHIFDLPDDVLLAHVFWILLEGHRDDSSGEADHKQCLSNYRLTSKAFQHYVDSCVTSARCDLSAAAAHPNWALQLTQRLQRWCSSRPISSGLERFHALLQRFPRLLNLDLSGWPTETALVAQLQLCARAAARHQGPTCLNLAGTLLDPSTLSAVRCHLPNLRELHVVNTCDRYTVRDTNLLESLQGSQLQKFSFESATWPYPHGVDLHFLRGLCHLRTLRLTLNLGARDVRQLGGLINLEDCTLIKQHPTGNLHDNFAPLFHDSSRLCSLRLHGWEHDWHQPDSTLALSHLRPLLLRCLDLGQGFVLDDLAWPHVSRLTLLTMLGAGCLRPTAPSGGHLPLLQHLALGVDRYNAEVPLAVLARSLLPLLPLPSLVGVELRSLQHGHLEAADGPGEEAALQAFASHLAAAPHLGHGHWRFRTTCRNRLSHAQLSRAMRPLVGRVTFTIQTQQTGHTLTQLS